MKLQAPLAACLAVAALYGKDLLAQPLTSEDVAGPINADFKPAANQCAAGRTVPPLVKIEVLIQKDGSAFMVSTSPAVDPDVEACLKAAMEKVKFRASGQAFKAVYSFKPAPQEAPPPAQPPGPAPAVPPAPPAAQPVPPVQHQEAPPSATAGNLLPQEQGIKPAVDQDLYRRVRISRGVMIGGFAAFGAMWLSMIVMSTVIWVRDIGDFGICWYDSEPCPDTEADHVNLGALAPLIGPFWSGADLLEAGYKGMGAWYILNPVLQIAFITTGIAGLAAMITAHKQMHRKQSVYKVMFLPLITKSPGKGQIVGGMLAGSF